VGVAFSGDESNTQTAQGIQVTLVGGYLTHRSTLQLL
jgi:hypothetical protein